MFDTGDKTSFIALRIGRCANRFHTSTFTLNTVGGEAFGNGQQFFASLCNQLQTGGDRDVGQYVRGVLDPQPILQQPMAASLTEQRVTDPLMSFHTQPTSKVSESADSQLR